MAEGGDDNRMPSGEPAASPNNTRVKLIIKCQDGREVNYSVRRDIQLQKLFLSFSDRVNLDYRTLNFLYNGERVPVKQTPNDLQMEDGDEIDAMMSLGGGGSKRRLQMGDKKNGGL